VAPTPAGFLVDTFVNLCLAAGALLVVLHAVARPTQAREAA
jgi:hypothetical protein